MMDETALRLCAREALEKGQFPHRRPDRMWGGPGTGEQCALCRQPVTRDDTALDVEFSDGEGLAPPVSHLFHVRCFGAWESERDRTVPVPRQGEYDASPTDTARIDVRGLRALAGDGTIPRRELNRSS
jgi:hypothetical protein